MELQNNGQNEDVAHSITDAKKSLDTALEISLKGIQDEVVTIIESMKKAGMSYPGIAYKLSLLGVENVSAPTISQLHKRQWFPKNPNRARQFLDTLIKSNVKPNN